MEQSTDRGIIEDCAIGVYNFLLKNRLIFLTGFIATIVSHGMMIFNKISLNDDPGYFFNFGSAYVSGRYGLGITWKIYRMLTGMSTYSLPVFNATIGFLLLTLMSVLLIEFLNIRKSINKVIITVFLISSPSVAGLLGYNFTFPIYCVAYICAVYGVCLICRTGFWSKLIGILFVSYSISIYQAALSMSIALLFLKFLYELLNDENISYTRWVARSICRLCMLVVGLVTYLLGNKIILGYLGESMIAYQGLNTMTKLSVETYMGRILTIYKLLYSGFDESVIETTVDYGILYFMPKSTNLFLGNLDTMYKIVLIYIVIVSGIAIVNMFKSSKIRALLLCLLMLVSPLMVYSIYILAEPKYVYTLMVYAGVMFLFIPIVFVESKRVFVSNSNRLLVKLRKSLSVLLVVICVGFIRIDNIAYLKAQIFQTQAISYYTTLIGRIKGIEGYRDDMRVAYIKTGNGEVKDRSVTVFSEFESICLFPYYSRSYILEHPAHEVFMKLWCAFNPVRADANLYRDREEVKRMPTYPNDGSIKIIDDTVVVKF